MIAIFNDELIARAISAAASEKRWDDIERIIEQYGRVLAASEELRPLVQDYVDERTRRELRENDEVDVLFERWAALRNEPMDDFSPALEQVFRLSRDARLLLRTLETDEAIRRVDELDRELKARDLPGVRAEDPEPGAPGNDEPDERHDCKA